MNKKEVLERLTQLAQDGNYPTWVKDTSTPEFVSHLLALIMIRTTINTSVMEREIMGLITANLYMVATAVFEEEISKGEWLALKTLCGLEFVNLCRVHIFHLDPLSE